MRTLKEIEKDVENFNKKCDDKLKAIKAFRMNHQNFLTDVKTNKE